MYTPKYSYNDNLVSKLIKIENNKTAIACADLSADIKTGLVINSRALDIFHFAPSLGIELTLKEAERIANGGKPENLDELNTQVLVAFRSAVEFNRSNVAETHSEIDLNVIRHLNQLTIQNWRENLDAKFRDMNERIDERFDKFIALRDKNITSSEIENCILDLIRWYENAIQSTPEVVRVAVLIHRLIEVSPFIAANQISIMVIADYLLQKHGLSFKIYSSTVRLFQSSEEVLIESYMLSQAQRNLDSWIEGFADALNNELITVREEIGKFITAEEKSKEQPFLDLNKRQLKVLKYLQNVPSIKREDYCHMMDVSTMTAFRDLKDLLRKKLIKADGQGRGTKYKLASY
jgi:Fic family protein